MSDYARLVIYYSSGQIFAIKLHRTATHRILLSDNYNEQAGAKSLNQHPNTLCLKLGELILDTECTDVQTCHRCSTSSI